MRARLARTLVSATVLVSLAASVCAHPGSGLEVAPDGTLYFADVFRTTIWSLVPGEDPEVLVADTWTHGITLTDQGSLLYFELEGMADGRTSTGLRRWSESHGVETVFPLSNDYSHFGGEAFALLEGLGVVFSHSIRGSDGEWRQELRVRPLDGPARWFSGSREGPLFEDGPAESASFRMVTDMIEAEQGGLYALDRDRIRHVDANGHVNTVLEGLLLESPPDPPQTSGPATTINRCYALDLAENGNFYVAYHAGRLVWKARPGAEPEVFWRSSGRWTPIGVTCDDSGVFVLENEDDTPRLRITRVPMNAGQEDPRIIEIIGIIDR